MPMKPLPDTHHEQRKPPNRSVWPTNEHGRSCHTSRQIKAEPTVITSHKCRVRRNLPPCNDQGRPQDLLQNCRGRHRPEAHPSRRLKITMRESVILRRKVTSNYTILPNQLINDATLSWRALGLLCYMLSLPHDFRLRLSHLSRQKQDGRHATRAGLRELEEAGYLCITRTRSLRGQFNQTIWTVTDTPSPRDAETPCSENPNAAPTHAASPTSDEPTLQSTEQEKVRRKTTATDGRPSYPLAHHAPLAELSNLMRPQEHAAITTMLANTRPEDTDKLLDELATALKTPGRIRTSPDRWFRGLLKNCQRNAMHTESPPPSPHADSDTSSSESRQLSAVDKSIGAKCIKDLSKLLQ